MFQPLNITLDSLYTIVDIIFCIWSSDVQNKIIYIYIQFQYFLMHKKTNILIDLCCI